jgi:predicted heme/steroid binding protein/uncharacterized membrane protein
VKGASADLKESLQEFTLEELQEFKGTAGQPAYILYEGRVIDVSASKRWPDGHHMATHRAGQDLTDEIKAAPHGPEVLERFPQVGLVRAADAAEEKIPVFLSRLFHYVPLLRRHPHPMVVHFPMVFMVSTSGFTILFLLTGNRSFELTAWYCLWGGVLFTPVAILTGLITWWVNYEAEFLRQVIIKLILSPLLFLLGMAVLIWRYLNPEILVFWEPLSYLYLGCLLTLTPLVISIGWFGGTLVFPLDDD